MWKMDNNLDDLLAFSSGSMLTFWTFMDLEQLIMAFILGLLGGIGGLLGKYLVYGIIKIWNNDWK